MKMPDRWLRALAPLVAREARDAPGPLWDEILGELQSAAGRRGLRSVIADVARVAAGGAPLEPDEPDRADATSSG